jgi:CRISP-associated protein Cas1
MMTRPDFIEKQILLIDSSSIKHLKFKNSNLILTDDNEKIILQNSCHKIFAIFVVGEFTITSVLIKNLIKQDISTIFLNFNLKPYFSINPTNKGNFLLRQKQYTSKINFLIAKKIVENKINNQLFLMDSLRYKTVKEKLLINKIKLIVQTIQYTTNNNELLGIEGTASKIFFEIYFKNLNFNGRRPKCKDNIFNLLLDIGYYYLFNFIDANLELYGFDTYCGVYHTFFFQRKSLVCDLMEPFRCIIDKKLKISYNLKQVNENDFYLKNNQFYVKREFNKKYSKLFLEEILKNKEEIFLYIQKYYRSFMKEKEISEFPIFSRSDEK